MDGLEDYPYLYFGLENGNLEKKVCVKQCPNSSNNI